MSQIRRNFFSGTNIIASGPFHYTDTAASTAITDGWIPAKSNSVVVQIGCASVGNALKYRIEGRYANSDRAASIHVNTITGTPSLDRFVTVTENVAEIRVGVTAASTIAASPIKRTITHKFYCNMILTENT